MYRTRMLTLRGVQVNDTRLDYLDYMATGRRDSLGSGIFHTKPASTQIAHQDEENSIFGD